MGKGRTAGIILVGGIERRGTVDQVIECSIPELLDQVRRGRIPMNAKIKVTIVDEAMQAPDPGNDSTLALFEKWEREDRNLTPEQQAENDRTIIYYVQFVSVDHWMRIAPGS